MELPIACTLTEAEMRERRQTMLDFLRGAALNVTSLPLGYGKCAGYGCTLSMGAKGKAMISQGDAEKREKTLRMAMERLLPDFVKSCTENVEPLVIHQDAFAVDYDEYELLGMAIKFAGLYEREVHIVGKNRETLRAAVAN